MAFTNVPTNTRDGSTDSQGSDISGLSAFEMDTTDSFDRRMAEQVHKQQLLRRATGGQPLFGRHRGGTSLRSVMGTLDRRNTGSSLSGPVDQVKPQTNEINILLDHEPSQQWGLKSTTRTHVIRRVLSSSNERALAPIDPTTSTSSEVQSVNKAVNLPKDTCPIDADSNRSFDRTLGSLHENIGLIGQDSPVSLRAGRRAAFDYQKQNKATNAYDTRLTRAKSHDSRFRRVQTATTGFLADGFSDTEAVPAGAQRQPDHESSTQNPKLLLKRLARAASLSPIHDSSHHLEQTAMDTGRHKLSNGTYQSTLVDGDQDVECAQNTTGIRHPLNVRHGGPDDKTQSVGVNGSNTPKVTGGWIDTPVANRRSGDASGPATTIDPKYGSHTGPTAERPTRLSHQYTQQDTRVEDHESDTHADQSKEACSHDSADTPVIREGLGLKKEPHSQETTTGLHTARLQSNETVRSMELIGPKIKVQQKSRRNNAVYASPDLRRLAVFWNELASLPERILARRPNRRKQFAWSCIVLLMVATSVFGEVTLCRYYCRPSFAHTMDGYGVDMRALRMPFITISLVLGPLEWLWRPLLRAAYWVAYWLTCLPALAGLAKSPTTNHEMQTSTPRETVVYDMYEWAAGRIGADETL